MKRVSTPPVDEDGCIRPDLTDFNAIIDNIDTAEGRNDALRAYILALRDLQHAHNEFALYGTVTAEAIGRAQAAVEAAFTRLIVAQFSLNLAA